MHLLRLALEAAVTSGLAEADTRGRDFFGRMELVEIALDDAHDYYAGQLPQR